jgi:hypothetical protein
MDFNQVETVSELRQWIIQFLPNATVQLSDTDVIIKTGLDVAMGDYLYPIEREGK